jgi:hypothetical protein
MLILLLYMCPHRHSRTYKEGLYLLTSRDLDNAYVCVESLFWLCFYLFIKYLKYMINMIFCYENMRYEIFEDRALQIFLRYYIFPV